MKSAPQPWLYDPTLSFYENLDQGPFGQPDEIKYQNSGEPKYDFFGTKVYSPFGIAAGPLPRAKFVKSALDAGYDIVTFKSVRTHLYECHPAPNVFPVKLQKLDYEKVNIPIITDSEYNFPLSLANSFGIPSFEPEIWQEELRQSFSLVKRGQAMLVAFQGTDRGKGHDAYIKDHVEGVGLLKQTCANVIEIDLSCPNEGRSSLLCFDVPATKEILVKIRQKHGNIKLIVKITYFPEQKILENFLKQITPLVDGVTAINTVGAPVIKPDGTQAFSGSPVRARAGISGYAIKHLGLNMVKRMDIYRKERGLNYKIIGVGGVQTPQDFQDYRAAGADIVMGLTGVMWNPKLAAQIKQSLPS
jgi:dihydroorotate dehydrogenase (NAD+) catalytic subunit